MSYYALFFYEGQNYGFSPIYYPDAFVAFKQHKLQREFVIPTNIRGVWFYYNLGFLINHFTDLDTSIFCIYSNPAPFECFWSTVPV